MSEEKSIKVIQFSGKHEDWNVWKEKFLAKANRKGFKEVLLGEVEIPKDSITTNEAKEIKKLNVFGFEELIMSMKGDTPEGKVAFTLVKNCKSDDYKSGNVAEAFESLMERYEPKDAPTLSDYHRQFYGARLRKRSDPASFITYMENLRIHMKEMGSVITDKQFMMQIINNLNQDYDMELKMLEEQIDNTEKPLTIDKMRTKLSTQFKRLKKMRSRHYDSSSDEEEGYALYAGGKFKGRCHKCGKWGHKSVDCRSKKQDGGGGYNNNKKRKKGNFNKFTGRCHYCNKVGHKKSECRLKKKDDEEKANRATENHEEAEVLLMAHDLDERFENFEGDKIEIENIEDIIDSDVEPVVNIKKEEEFRFDDSSDEEDPDGMEESVSEDEPVRKKRKMWCQMCSGFKTNHTTEKCLKNKTTRDYHSDDYKEKNTDGSEVPEAKFTWGNLFSSNSEGESLEFTDVDDDATVPIYPEVKIKKEEDYYGYQDSHGTQDYEIVKEEVEEEFEMDINVSDSWSVGKTMCARLTQDSNRMEVTYLDKKEDIFYEYKVVDTNGEVLEWEYYP